MSGVLDGPLVWNGPVVTTLSAGVFPCNPAKGSHALAAPPVVGKLETEAVARGAAASLGADNDVRDGEEGPIAGDDKSDMEEAPDAKSEAFEALSDLTSVGSSAEVPRGDGDVRRALLPRSSSARFEH